MTSHSLRTYPSPMQHGFCTDVRTLFHMESERRKALGGEAVALTVSIPEILQLKTNYRTHQGILDTAALLVVRSNY
jgi:hypothetical protein